MRIDLYNKFMNDFLAWRGRAHAIVVRGGSVGPTTQITENLARNTGGFYEIVPSANGLPNLMKTLAERIALDQ